MHDIWYINLLKNVSGYGIIILIVYILIKLCKKNEYFISSKRGLYKYIRIFIYGDISMPLTSKDVELNDSDGKSEQEIVRELPLKDRLIRLFVCSTGLLFFYLIWGIMQERTMTQSYGIESEKFTHSEFLVFVNRIMAFILSSVVLFFCRKSEKSHMAPIWMYTPASLTNIVSAWFQYEALKFVSFPTQVMIKACKIVPVLLVGLLLFRRKYNLLDYVQAILISIGMSIFMLETSTITKVSKHVSNVETLGNSFVIISGLICMSGYLITDAYTSQWQQSLFKKYSMSTIQMMCGINLISSTFTFASLLGQGILFDCISFGMKHMEFIFHATITGCCSAFGQLFIFRTIRQFGAVTLVTIMIIRQCLSVLSSYIIFGHDELTWKAWAGILITFGSLLGKVLYQERQKKQIINQIEK